MSNLLRYLHIEHDFEHKVKQKKRYSEPKIYDANGDLAKRWYVYFSFRKKSDGPLERFPNNIYAPQHLEKRERLLWLKTMQRNLSLLFKDGFNPYNPENKFNFEDDSESKSIKEAFEFAYTILTRTSGILIIVISEDTQNVYKKVLGLLRQDRIIFWDRISEEKFKSFREDYIAEPITDEDDDDNRGNNYSIDDLIAY